jgi:hypothetical protein
MHAHKFWFGLLLLTVVSIKTEGKKKPSDPEYVQQFPGTLTVRTYLGEKIAAFRIADKTRDENLQFRPNNILGLGVGVTIKGIGLNFSTRLPLHETKEAAYGKTSRLDIQVHRYQGSMSLDVYLQRYRGFHLNEKSDVTNVVGPTEYPYYPNLQSITAGASGMYMFNGRRFSLRSMFNQQEWQLRSAGSLMLGASLFTHFLSNKDSSVIPTNLRLRDFLDTNLFKKINNYGLTINGGYGYNLVLKQHWFISLSGDVGVGPGYSSATTMEGRELHNWGLLVNTNARFGAGYNSREWFVGVYSIYRTDVFQLPVDDSKMRQSQGIFRFVVARRLTTQKRRLGGSPNQ